MKFDVKELGNGGVEVAIGTAATIVSIHAARRLPNYAGWVLLGAGLIGYVVAAPDKKDGGLNILKTASIVVASVGAVKALNMIGQENGVPASAGIKGMINKIVPQLNGVEGFGNVESMNENLLGSAKAADLLGLGEGYEEEIQGLYGDDLERLTGVDDDEIMEGLGDNEEDTIEGLGDLM